MPSWGKRFLESYAANGSVKEACKYAGVSREAHYKNLRNNPVYAAAVQQTEDEVAQMLEDLAVQRVVDGQPVLYQGEPVEINGVFLREYDTQLHCVLLKRFRPELYRERSSVDVTATIDLAERLTQARSRVTTITRNENESTGTTG